MEPSRSDNFIEICYFLYDILYEYGVKLFTNGNNVLISETVIPFNKRKRKFFVLLYRTVSPLRRQLVCTPIRTLYTNSILIFINKFVASVNLQLNYK